MTSASTVAVRCARHRVDGVITSARPRPPSGHSGRRGRRDHDGRAPCTGRIVAANRVVGGVRGDARAVVVDGLDQLDARRRVIARRVRARVSDDHTGVINTHRECLPPARAPASMFRRGPFTRAGNRQASAVDEEMKACAPWNAPKGCVATVADGGW